MRILICCAFYGGYVSDLKSFGFVTWNTIRFHTLLYYGLSLTPIGIRPSNSTNLYSGRKSKLAKRHLKEVGTLLGKIDPHLTELANESIPETNPKSPITPPRKRKGSNLDDAHIPKKKITNSHNDRSGPVSTLSQREDRAMKNLIKHILDSGGMSPSYFCSYYLVI